MNRFEWDQNKNKSNIQKHGIDFLDAIEVFDDPNRIYFESERNGEKRTLLVGLMKEYLVAVVFISRGGNYRIISVRRARKNEKEKYQSDY